MHLDNTLHPHTFKYAILRGTLSVAVLALISLYPVLDRHEFGNKMQDFVKTSHRL